MLMVPFDGWKTRRIVYAVELFQILKLPTANRSMMRLFFLTLPIA